MTSNKTRSADGSVGDRIPINFLVGLNYTDARRGYIVANNPSAANYDPSYPVSLGDTISPGGPQTTPNPGSYWNKRNFNYDLTYRHKTTNGQWQFSYWKNDERRREVNYSTAGVLVFDRDVVTDLSDSFAFTGKEKRQGHEFGYGLEYKRLRYGDGTWYVKPDRLQRHVSFTKSQPVRRLPG